MISAVVLAAGTSSRFGATKQLAPLRDRSLLQHVVDAAASATTLDEIVVVLGHDATRVERTLELPLTGRVIRNAAFASGQAGSLAAGLRATSTDSKGAVVLLGDQPGVDPADIDRLARRFGETRSRIVRLAYRDGPGPALLSREIYEDALHLPGDAGARTLIASHPDWVTEVAVPSAAPRDVDTPNDLRLLEDEH